MCALNSFDYYVAQAESIIYNKNYTLQKIIAEGDDIMKQIKKVLAAILCVVFCLTLVPTWTFAENSEAIAEEPLAEVNMEEIIPEEVFSEPEIIIEEDPGFEGESVIIPEETVEADDMAAVPAEEMPAHADETEAEEEPGEETMLPAMETAEPGSESELPGAEMEEDATETAEIFAEEQAVTEEQMEEAPDTKEDEQNVSEDTEFGSWYVLEGAVYDNTLLDAYAAQQLGLIDRPILMSPADPTAGFNDAQKKAYNILSACIRETAAGERSSTVYDVDFEVGEAPWTENALWIQQVYNSLVFSFPYELYWHDSQGGVGFWFTYTSDNYVTRVRCTFAVSDDYDNGETTTITGPNGERTVFCGVEPVGQTVTGAVENAKNIVNASAAGTDLDKLINYKNKICELTDYNQAAADEDWDYGNPWQLIWVFDENPETKVVCEGYAKAFEYLCDNSSFASNGVRCYCVSGNMQVGNDFGPHMWNIVTMDDGKNYLVDVTNCDNGSVGAPDLLFLKGYTDNSENISYGFACGGGRVYYSYDNETTGFYSAEELTLSSIAYGSGSETGNLSPFEELEAACREGKDYTVTADDLVVERDLVIPAGITVVMQNENSTLTVPAGKTLTVLGELETVNLKIEAGARIDVRNDAYLYAEKSATIEQEGTLVVDASMMGIESEAWDDTLAEKITCINSGTVFIYESLSNAEELYQRLDSFNRVSDSVVYQCEFNSSCELTRNETTIPAGVALVVYRDKLAVPEGKTLRIEENAEIIVVGADLSLDGTLVNDGAVRLYDNLQSGLPVTVTLGENGVYSEESTGTVTYNGDPYQIVNNSTIFEQLKAACEDENIHYFDLRNRGNFVIDNLEIPVDFRIDAYGTTIVVPASVTLTVAENAAFEVEALSVEAGGIVDVRKNARINIYNELAMNGSILLGENAEGHFPAGGMDAAAREGIQFGSNSHATLHYNVDSEEALYRAKAEAEQLSEPFNGNLQLLVPWTLTEDISFDGAVGLDVDGAWNQGSIIVPAGKTLTINSYLNIRGGSLTVQGTLQNNGWIELRAEENEDPNCNQDIGRIVVENDGNYSGLGRIWVGTESNPDSYLSMDLTGFVKNEHNGGTLYVNAGGLAEEFLDACANPDQYHNYYDRLSDQESFIIPITESHELVIPENLHVNCWNTMITVPSGMTLKVLGQFDAESLQIESGATVVAGEGSGLRIHESLVLNGTINVDNTWISVPVSSWNSSWLNGLISFIGTDSGVEVEIPAYTQEDIDGAPSVVQIAERVRPSIFVRFPWIVQGDMTIANGANFHIQNEPGNNWNGSLTVPAGVTLENRSYLGLHNAELSISGALKNEGYIDVRQDDGTESRIILGNEGSYSGFGEIWVGTETTPEQYLEGLTTRYEFVRHSEREGTLFRLAMGFEWLKQICSETYEEGGDHNYYEIPNEGRFVIEENLTIPRYLQIDNWNGEIYIPAGVTLTLEGAVNCNKLIVDGELVIKEGTWLGVHNSLEVNGGITVLNHGHMDLKYEAWADSFNTAISLGEENSWINVYYDVESAADVSTGLGCLENLNAKPGIGKSLNIYFPWTLEENLVLPEGVGLSVSASWDNQNGSLVVPEDITLTLNDYLRIADTEATIHGTLVNHGNIDLVRDNWNTEDSGRIGRLTLAAGGRYQGEGDIWISTALSPQSYLIGFQTGLLTEELFENDAHYYHSHLVTTVIENEVPATCAEPGSYDDVERCSTCGEELNRTHVHTDPIPHTYGEPIWGWSIDYSRLTVAFECSTCGEREYLEGSITVTPGTGEQEFIYTGTVTFNGQTYTDVRTVKKSAYDIDPKVLNVILGKTGEIHVISSDTQERVEYPGTLTWTVSDESVATVDSNGRVTPLKAGFTWVTVHSENGDLDADCQVFVLFSDVDNPGAYFYNPVYWAVSQGITSGTSATTFSPYNSCTRAQVMAFLYKAKGSPDVSVDNPFTDVRESDYFYKPVLWAVSEGITSGTSATTFSPYNSCTRAQVMAFLYKAFG